ncbi:putative MFS family arabinose efflux permease [Allocatelliglobosispora scoriae]|uniref:Putative MFS family arabinose efflux permease n=1 Tax=Allocatelliglobosispora scoriae TaxID=643052 RepID=A0A841BJG1_9ACTN|nr:MFS transporter [Allocatelliglobosispora scoriae]MBB5866960.1 putative MFS family arabinose efflux permease [Allocatelliglobosispora scoriae]
MLRDTYLGVLRQPGFRRLLAGLGISYLGDGMSAVVIAWLALTLAAPGQEGAVTAAALAAYSLPAVIGALTLSRWLGGLPSRRLVIGNALLRATMLGTAAALHLAGELRPWSYVVLLALSSLLAAWGQAGIYSLVGALIPAEGRLAANSLVNTALNTAIVLGPPAAGLLVAAVNPGVALALDAVSFLALALAVRGITVTAVEPSTEDGRRSGLRLLVRRPELLALALVTAGFWFLYGPVEVALPIHIDAGGGSARLLGAYWAAFGIGAIVGGLLGGLLRTQRTWPFVIAVVIAWGGILLPFGFGAPTGLTVAMFAVGGLVYGPFPAFITTAFQNATPPGELSTVLAAKGALTGPATPLGMIAGGVMVTAWGGSWTLFASGAATIALALAVAAWRMLPLRRPAPETQPA